MSQYLCRIGRNDTSSAATQWRLRWNCGLPVERDVCCFVLFRGTRRVDRDLSGMGARLDQIVLHQVLFHFFAADVGEHHAINLNAWRKRLATLLFHLPTERRVLDDVLLLIRKVVLA